MKTLKSPQKKKLKALARARAEQTIGEVAPKDKKAAYEAVMSDFMAGAMAAVSTLTEDGHGKE